MRDINKISKEELMDEYIKKKDAILAFDDDSVERYYGDVDPESVIRVIENIPAADVRPVVRGKWKLGVCQTCFFDWSKVAPVANVPNFCPNCGARMDKDSFDDNPPMEYFESGGK